MLSLHDVLKESAWNMTWTQEELVPADPCCTCTCLSTLPNQRGRDLCFDVFFATVVAENMTCVMMGLLWFAYSDWGIWFENDKPIETNWNFKNTFQGQASSWKSSRNWLPQSCRQGQRLPRGYGCNTTCIQTPGLNKHRTHGCLHCFLRWRRHLPKFR